MRGAAMKADRWAQELKSEWKSMKLLIFPL